MRCFWVKDSDEKMIKYHDEEYGVMITDNNKMFELLSLELNQTGLSWKIILDKREAFNDAFFNFNIEKIATTNFDLELLLANKGIIRHRLKLEAVINNAKVIYDNKIDLISLVMRVFDDYGIDYINAVKEYKRLGFKFIGPSVIESLYMAIGLIEGHEETCYRFGGK